MTSELDLPTIRIATPADIPGMLAIYNPIVASSPIAFDVIPLTEPEFQARLSEVLAQTPWLVCAREEQVLGYAYAARFRPRAAYRWTVETTVYIHSDYRRSGIGTALYTVLLGLLRLQGYRNVVAAITLPNPASVGLHERMGFRCVGVFPRVGFKLGAWHDVGWWVLPLEEGDNPPSEPVPWHQLAETPEWKAAFETGRALLQSVWGQRRS